MKIALTGANGRLGRGIVRHLLARDHEVVAIDRTSEDTRTPDPRLDVRTLELDDYDALADAMVGCDALIHMAAIPVPGRHPDHVVHNNNVTGSYNALHAAIAAGIRRICQASSVNAIGHAFSRQPRYDYFPLDEAHPNYCEEPYSLSKWICEQQADSFARRHDDLSIASLRFHYVTPDRDDAAAKYTIDGPHPDRHLWAWTHLDAAADACLRAVEGRFTGHEVFYIVAPETLVEVPTTDLVARVAPHARLRLPLAGNASFFDSSKAERLLGWSHDAAIGASA
jgi:UDP-glucose 4-epimerase